MYVFSVTRLISDRKKVQTNETIILTKTPLPINVAVPDPLGVVLKRVLPIRLDTEFPSLK